MLILSMDTSAAEGSVALLRGGGPELLTVELAQLPGGHASEQLLPDVAAILERHGLPRQSVELLVVASGPGSFTGLRVAVATVKGLAQAFGTPLVAVSVLQAVALAAKVEGRVTAVLDAQRKEVFFGEYMVENGGAVMQREGLAPLAEFAAAIAQEPRTIVTPDTKVAEAMNAAFLGTHRPVQLVIRPNAVDYARIALARHLAGEHDDPVTLDANYLRRSDAEIFSAPKLGLPKV